MADIRQSLLIKYGLRSQPSPELAAQWAAATQELIARGVEPSLAGTQIARVLFPDYETCKYASEADSIAALLAAAAENARRQGGR